jgi:hypothetical protein
MKFYIQLTKKLPSEQLGISSPFLRAKINSEEENLSRNLVLKVFSVMCGYLARKSFMI